MDGMTVSQLAGLTGVPRTTLRFYEQQGLLAPRRSASGYRLFDDVAVDQLRFIATAKSLGLALDDVATLLAPWRHEGCREVQRALTPMLRQRRDEAREQVARTEEFAARLDDALCLLEEIDRDGPCDRSCAFLRRDHGTPPAVCALPAPAWHDRRARWRRVLVHEVARWRSPDGGLRIELAPAVLDDGGTHELVELVRAEARCCPRLEITASIGAAVAVEVAAGEREAVAALFGE